MSLVILCLLTRKKIRAIDHSCRIFARFVGMEYLLRISFASKGYPFKNIFVMTNSANTVETLHPGLHCWRAIMLAKLVNSHNFVYKVCTFFHNFSMLYMILVIWVSNLTIMANSVKLKSIY